jgi:hypothetical protein
MTLRSNGTYTAQFHMHDSGFSDYDFSVHAIWAANNGITFVSVHGGHVEGTVSSGLFSGPRRDDDFTDNGFNPLIRASWAAVQAGRLWVTKDYNPTGVVGFIQDAAKIVVDAVAGAVATTVGVIIALGSEAGRLFRNLGLGGTFGVLAGVVVFAVGGGIVMAVVAGVAVGAVTNALIKQRPLAAGIAVRITGLRRIAANRSRGAHQHERAGRPPLHHAGGRWENLCQSRRRVREPTHVYQ